MFRACRCNSSLRFSLYRAAFHRKLFFQFCNFCILLCVHICDVLFCDRVRIRYRLFGQLHIRHPILHSNLLRLFHFARTLSDSRRFLRIRKHFIAFDVADFQFHLSNFIHSRCAKSVKFFDIFIKFLVVGKRHKILLKITDTLQKVAKELLGQWSLYPQCQQAYGSTSQRYGLLYPKFQAFRLKRR